MTERRELPHWLQHWWLWFALLFAITFAIFWPSFFSAITNVDLPIVIHGLSATGWMLLTVFQALMIRSRKRKAHHLIGYSSLILAIVLVASALVMEREMILRDGTDTLGEPLLSLKFFYNDIGALVLFCLFLGLAILAARRRDIPMHLRYIACTAFMPLVPALERAFLALDLTPDWTSALHASLATLAGVTAVITFVEWRYRRLRWPFPGLFGYYLLMYLTTDLYASTAFAEQFAFGFAGR